MDSIIGNVSVQALKTTLQECEITFTIGSLQPILDHKILLIVLYVGIDDSFQIVPSRPEQVTHSTDPTVSPIVAFGPDF